MGSEAHCRVTWKAKTWVAAVHLDSSAVEVRGRPKLVLPLAEVSECELREGALLLRSARGVLELRLGAEAASWARKIRNPKSRAEKLGIRSGQRVAFVGLDDPVLAGEVAARGARIVSGRGAVDVLFFGVTSARDLARLSALRERIEPEGSLWLVRTKGKAATVKEGEVRSAARAAGLVDVKVIAFSETQTSDKFVVPVAQRVGKAAR